MNTKELENYLAEKNIPKDVYSLYGGFPNEKLVLSQESNGKWEVYHSERGQKTNLLLFLSENDACIHFLKLIKEMFPFRF